MYVIVGIVVLSLGFDDKSHLDRVGAAISLLPLLSIFFLWMIRCCDKARQAIIFGILVLAGIFPFIGGFLLIAGAGQYGSSDEGVANAVGSYITGALFILAGIGHCIGCGLTSYGVSGTSDAD